MRSFAIGFVLLRCATAASFEAVEPHMGTLVRVQLDAPDPTRAKAAFRAAFERIAQIDAALTDYKPDSELNRLSREGVGRPAPVSADLFTVLKAAQSLSEKTEGAFDITIGPLTRLWREARKAGHPPAPAAIEAARQHCGYLKLHLDGTARTAQLDEPGMQLDLGAIAKGYAADEALEAVTKLGIASALIAVSGDLAFSNPRPGEAAWTVGIDVGFPRTLELVNGAVSTSGPTEQYLEANGQRYSHIIDPATGLGLTQDLRVTVIARRGLTADGWATALSVLGVERGLKLLEKEREITALFALTENGHTRIYESAQVRRFVRKSR